MSLPLIAQAGHPALRQEAKPVPIADISGQEIQELIQVLRDVMRAAPGVGLAAPQIGVGLQVAVVEDRAEYQDGIAPAELKAREREPVPFHVLINPEIKVYSEEKVVFFEGCLSIAGYSGLVARHRSVQVSYWDERGEHSTIWATGWYARILQHEIDHLRGALYIDRMSIRSFSTVENIKRYWADKDPQAVEAALKRATAAESA